jgi:phosphotriesterase-related protein
MNYFIESALGPIEKSEMRWIHPHEHLLGGMNVQAGVTVKSRPGCIEYIRRQMLMMLPDLSQYGVNGLVDALTIDIGRDDDYITYVQELSRSTGINVFLLTGFYVPSAWPDWVRQATPNVLSDFMIREFEEGIGKTNVRPSAIKAAIQHDVHAPFEDEWRLAHEKILTACSLAHRNTGAALHIHSAAGSRRQTVEFLLAAGVVAEHIYLAHVEMGASEEEFLWLAEQGVRLVVTCWGSTHMINQQELVRLVKLLVDRGHVNKLLLSMDFRFSLMNKGRDIMLPLDDNFNNCSFSYLHTHALPLLRNAGISLEQINVMMHDNPLEMLTPLLTAC